MAKRADIVVGRCTHAHQFKRARRQLKFLRTRLDRIIRGIRRKIDGDAVLEARFGPLLELAQRVRTQDQHQRGPRSMRYMLWGSSASARGMTAPYEFGCWSASPPRPQPPDTGSGSGSPVRSAASPLPSVAR